jgi:Fe2+ or Zn2+ uptake regulation protein
MTGQRRAILNALDGDVSHPTADAVYHKVREHMPHISLGTVYRNLKMLSESGHILEIEIADAPNRYDFRNDQHYHFHCEQCGQVMDLDIPYQQSLNDALAQDGFQISRHDIQFHGRCAECQVQPIH